MRRRVERFNSLIRDIVSSFIRLNIDSKTIVTVMRAESSDDLKTAKIFLSVFPEGDEKRVIEILERKKHGLKEYLKSRIKIKFLPSIFFEIDRALKIERTIDEILK